MRGLLLRSLRRDRRISQVELAATAQVTVHYVKQLEKGRQTKPPLPVLQRLAKALGVAVGELLE